MWGKFWSLSMWQIVVIMMVGMLAEKDAIEITHNDGKLLLFETQEICYAHVYENLDKLKEYINNDKKYPNILYGVYTKGEKCKN